MSRCCCRRRSPSQRLHGQTSRLSSLPDAATQWYSVNGGPVTPTPGTGVATDAIVSSNNGRTWSSSGFFRGITLVAVKLSARPPLLKRLVNHNRLANRLPKPKRLQPASHRPSVNLQLRVSLRRRARASPSLPASRRHRRKQQASPSLNPSRRRNQ